MTCAELMDALVDYLAQELVIEYRETFDLHLRGCVKCESYVATYTHTVRITRALPKCGKQLSAEFEARFRKALEEETGKPKVE